MKLQKIKLPFSAKKPILALGSQTKNTLCFVRDTCAYLSPVQQNLSTLKDFLRFQKSVKYFLKKNPKIIAHDFHPEYQSTKYAQQLFAKRYPLSAIQHHHAHIAACMLDNGLTNQKIIGVAFDGTGLGTDNTLWGAEFLSCDYKNFKRNAHLKEIPLLGQDRAILEPWRLTAIWLYQAYKTKFLNLGINFVNGIDRNKWQVLKKMYLSGFNSPLASSMGRLFDAVASLVLVKYKVDFEAQLALELEKMTAGYLPLRQAGKLSAIIYNFKIAKNKNTYILDPLPMFKQIITDLKLKKPKEEIAYRFHLTVSQMVNKVCLILRKETKINKVALSGGVFQNKLLLSLSLDLLYKAGFKVFTHKNFPSNDSSISLGQVAIANFGS